MVAASILVFSSLRSYLEVVTHQLLHGHQIHPRIQHFPGLIELIPLAAGVLAWAGVLLIPAAGAVLMSLSTVVVAINARFLKLA